MLKAVVQLEQVSTAEANWLNLLKHGYNMITVELVLKMAEHIPVQFGRMKI